MPSIEEHQKLFLEYLESNLPNQSPENLYEPARYILKLGGKRIRPILTLISAEIFNVQISNALPAALAIEVFHNFTLVHDDIMDKAPIRRGKKTVHKKWNINTAILSGDVMIIWSYELLLRYSPEVSSLMIKTFSDIARKVCEGQQLDMDFPDRETVTIDEYMGMIENKTAVLIGFALSIGAIVSRANNDQIANIYDIGLELGLAFQLQDDYLDVFGDLNKIGKQIGGDIIENKKTFLHLYVMANSSEKIKKEFSFWVKQKPNNPKEKILAVTSIFRSSGAEKAIINKIENFSKSIDLKVDDLVIDQNKKEKFLDVINKLFNRDF